MSNRKVSKPGLNFIAGHEGFVSHYYLDPVGVGTLGFGFTSSSSSVRKLLGSIIPGMKITRKKAIEVLELVINSEYGKAANAKMNKPNQHEFDMGCSGSFNVGPRIFGWKWCKAFNEGNKKKAAALWRNTATTAKGKKLAGLVRRRSEEANLLFNGDYGSTGFISFKKTKKVAKADSELLEYQKKLIKLGYDTGAADGWMGPKTTKAVKAFQKSDPHLINDGILGRGTMDSIDRLLENNTTKRNISIAGITGTGMSILSWIGNQSDLIMYVVLGALLLIIGYVLIKYRRKFEAKLFQYIG